MDTRSADLETLRRDWKTASSQDRRLIEAAANKIRKEDRLTRSMREALVKEHRKGSKDNIKDIHDITAKKARYQNG